MINSLEKKKGIKWGAPQGDVPVKGEKGGYEKHRREKLFRAQNLDDKSTYS